MASVESSHIVLPRFDRVFHADLTITVTHLNSFTVFGSVSFGHRTDVFEQESYRRFGCVSGTHIRYGVKVAPFQLCVTMSERASLSASTPQSALEEFPPSAKLVAKTLEHEGPLSQTQLAESTLLPARTVRAALAELKKHDLVTARVSFMDARKRIYSLETGAPK